MFICCTSDKYRAETNEYSLYEVDTVSKARRRQDSYSTATVVIRVIFLFSYGFQHRSRSKNESYHQRFQVQTTAASEQTAKEGLLS